MRARVTFVSIAAATLASCGSGDGTSISINASGDNGTMAAGIDRNGSVKVDLPGGFSGNIKLPRLKIDAEDFDLNGVRLFPGSTIGAMNIDAKEGGAGKDEGRVRVSFESPADPARVRDWFLERLSKDAGFNVTASGNALLGTTDEKQPFRLDLTPAGPGRSKGTIVIGG